MANSISSIDTPNNVIVTTQEGNIINIPQTTINTVKVNSTGPQGPRGSQGPTGSGADVGTSPTNVYLTPTSITCQENTNINLSGSEYATGGMFKLSWTGNQGNMIMYLPDATDSNNTYRAIRFITNSSYNVNTRTYLTPPIGQTLDGSTGFYEINKEYEGVTVWSDGIEWFKIQTKS